MLIQCSVRLESGDNQACAMVLSVFHTSSIGKSCLWLQASNDSIFFFRFMLFIYYCLGCKTTKEVCQLWAHLLAK